MSISGSFNSFFNWIIKIGNSNATFGSIIVRFSYTVAGWNKRRLNFGSISNVSLGSPKSDDCVRSCSFMVVGTAVGGRAKSLGTLNRFSVVSNSCSY